MEAASTLILSSPRCSDAFYEDLLTFTKQFLLHIQKGVQAEGSEITLSSKGQKKKEVITRLMDSIATIYSVEKKDFLQPEPVLEAPSQSPTFETNSVEIVTPNSKTLTILEMADDAYIETETEAIGIAEPSPGTLLIGRFDGWIEEVKAGSAKHRTFKGSGQKISKVRCILVDPKKRLWISTNDALLVLSRNEKLLYYEKHRTNLNLFYGHTRPLIAHPKWHRVLSWHAMDTIQIKDTSSFKTLIVVKGLLANLNEMPIDFTFPHDDWTNLMLLTLYKYNGHYHQVNIYKREKMFNNAVQWPDPKVPCGYFGIAVRNPEKQLLMAGTHGGPSPSGMIALFDFSSSRGAITLTPVSYDIDESYPIMSRPLWISPKLVMAVNMRDVIVCKVQNKTLIKTLKIVGISKGDGINDYLQRGERGEEVLVAANGGLVFRIKFNLLAL